MGYEKLVLSAADYGIFASTLLVSTTIGLYFRFAGKQQKTNEEFLLAGRDMAILPVTFSLMATFMSTTTLMGIPAEMYLYGTNMAFMNIGFVLGPFVVAYLFLPVYFETGVSTVYEYLEKRFGKTTRRILSAIFVLQYVLFNAVTLYAPALALSAVTNLPMWVSVLSIGTVCTLYCTLAGMKAVLWTDVFQAVLMFACLFAVIAKGTLDMGSLAHIFDVAQEGGRIVVPSLQLDMAKRYTLLSVFLQGFIITTSCYGCSQIQVQRMLTLKNVRRSRIATFLSIPMLVVFQLLCCICGLLFYAYFRSCDPITSPGTPIHSADQLMPFYITSAMSEYPGLPGLCISGIFSSSLSTVSSCINSLAAVTWEDLVHPLWPSLKHSVTITKTFSALYGVLGIMLSFFASSLGNLVKASIIVVGLTMGPTLGIFLLATLSTKANEEGAVLGILSGVVLAACLSFIPDSTKYPELPVSNDCSSHSIIPFSNGTIYNFTAAPTDPERSDRLRNPVMSPEYLASNSTSPEEIFPLSFMWISPLSLLACFIVGFVSSYIAGYFRKSCRDVPSVYFSPIRRWFMGRSSSRAHKHGKEQKESIHL